MTLGQLSDHNNALKYYTKGIELFNRELDNTNDYITKKKLLDSISSANASLSELYMNSDLCYEKNAEQKCEEYLKKGLECNPDSLDVLIQLSNLRILRCRDNEALQFMERIYNYIQLCLDRLDEFPSEDLLANLAKNYSELEQYAKAIKIYDILIKMNDENVIDV
jgi:tetratricopeptide (TPR) repeat protein